MHCSVAAAGRSRQLAFSFFYSFRGNSGRLLVAARDMLYTPHDADFAAPAGDACLFGRLAHTLASGGLACTPPSRD